MKFVYFLVIILLFTTIVQTESMFDDDSKDKSNKSNDLNDSDDEGNDLESSEDYSNDDSDPLADDDDDDSDESDNPKGGKKHKKVSKQAIKEKAKHIIPDFSKITKLVQALSKIESKDDTHEIISSTKMIIKAILGVFHDRLGIGDKFANKGGSLGNIGIQLMNRGQKLLKQHTWTDLYQNLFKIKNTITGEDGGLFDGIDTNDLDLRLDILRNKVNHTFYMNMTQFSKVAKWAQEIIKAEKLPLTFNIGFGKGEDMLSFGYKYQTKKDKKTGHTLLNVKINHNEAIPVKFYSEFAPIKTKKRSTKDGNNELSITDMSIVKRLSVEFAPKSLTASVRDFAVNISRQGHHIVDAYAGGMISLKIDQGFPSTLNYDGEINFKQIVGEPTKRKMGVRFDFKFMGSRKEGEIIMDKFFDTGIFKSTAPTYFKLRLNDDDGNNSTLIIDVNLRDKKKFYVNVGRLDNDQSKAFVWKFDWDKSTVIYNVGYAFLSIFMEK